MPVLPARAGKARTHVTSKATGGTGHQYCAWSGGGEILFVENAGCDDRTLRKFKRRPYQSRTKEIACVGGWRLRPFMELALYAPGTEANTPMKQPEVRCHAGVEAATLLTPENFAYFWPAGGIPVTGSATKTEYPRDLGVWRRNRACWRCRSSTSWRLRCVARSRYTIVDLSGTLRASHQEAESALARATNIWCAGGCAAEDHGRRDHRQRVLDAMPVQLLQRTAGQWHERGVVLGAGGDEAAAWEDRSHRTAPACGYRWPA